MQERLLAYFSRFRPLTEEEREAILEGLTTCRYDRKAFLLMAGQEAQYNYFVLGGFLRKYYVNEGVAPWPVSRKPDHIRGQHYLKEVE